MTSHHAAGSGEGGGGGAGGRDAVAAALAIAAGSVAYATPVRFENDGSFVWNENFLDVTRGVRAQTGLAAGAGSFEHLITTDSPSDPYYWYNTIRGGSPTDEVDYVLTPRISWFYGIDRFDLGEVIPNGPDEWTREFQFGYYAVTFYRTDWGGYDGPYVPGFMAVRFELSDGAHYGWVELGVEDGRWPEPNMLITALAWGYETEVDTPIPAGAVPGASPLAVLAIGAMAGASRGRRTG